MATESICPICGFYLVSAETDACPQCDADLTCFKVLNSIPDEAPSSPEIPVSARRPSATRTIMGAVFLLIGGLISGLFLAEIHSPEAPCPGNQRAFPIRIKIVEVRKKETLPMVEAEKEPIVESAETGFVPESGDKPSAPPAASEKALRKTLAKSDTPDGMTDQEIFTVYETAGDDTLWRISKKCYGSGFYFPVLMELNSGLGVYNLAEGMRLKIFRDSGRAEKLYREIIRVSGKRVRYEYRVVKGDSFERIAMKFYGPEGKKQRIMDLNPHATLLPGKRIQVELK